MSYTNYYLHIRILSKSSCEFVSGVLRTDLHWIFKIRPPGAEMIKKNRALEASFRYFESKVKSEISLGDIHVHTKSRKVFVDVMEVQTWLNFCVS